MTLISVQKNKRGEEEGGGAFMGLRCCCQFTFMGGLGLTRSHSRQVCW